MTRSIDDMKSVIENNIANEQLQTPEPEEITQALADGNVSDALFKITQVRDSIQNIQWIANDEQDPPVIIRDARAANNELPSDKHGYAMQGLNAIRACKKLIETNQSGNKPIDPRTAALLQQLSIEFWKTISISPDGETALEVLSSLNKSLINMLSFECKLSEAEAKERLSVAKDFASLEDPSRAVITINQTTDKKTFFIADNPLTKLTKDQQEQYENLQTKKWYIALPEWEKKLVNEYRDKLRDGTHVIPTQLRGCSVGLRNAYHEICGMIGDNNKVKVLHDNLHTGTVAHLGINADEDETIAALNVKQLEDFYNEVKAPNNIVNEDISINEEKKTKVHLVTLNSEYNASPFLATLLRPFSWISKNLGFSDFSKKLENNDWEIVRESRKAVKNNNGRHSNLAMNVFRKFTPNDYTGAKVELNDVINLLISENTPNPENPQEAINSVPKDLIKIIGYLQSNKKTDFEKATKAVNNLPKKHRKFAKAALCCHYLIKHNHEIRDKKNLNLSITSYLNIINYEKRRQFPEKNYPIIVYTCQSGKDRTGVVKFNNAIESILYKITGKFRSPTSSTHKTQSAQELEAIRQDLIQQHAKGCHEGFLAGINGGTSGCFSVKSDSKKAIPNTYPKADADKNLPATKDFLIRRTAKFNKKLHVKGRENHLTIELEETDTKETTLNKLILVAIQALQHRRMQIEKQLAPSTSYEKLKNCLSTTASKTQLKTEKTAIDQAITNIKEMPVAQVGENIIANHSQVLTFFQNAKNAASEKNQAFYANEVEEKLQTLEAKYNSFG